MNLSVLLAIIAGILILVGFIGTFVPVLPGAPLAWAGLLAAYFSSYCDISITALIITGIFAIAVSVLDNILPILMTKKFGGSKAATTGATIGLIIGFFIGPVGIIAGPFFGALIGEMIHKEGKTEGVFKAAFGAFMGFLTGTGIKMICVLFFAWYYIASFF
ncbi:MAG: DUF456 domain-containing protein [Treponema sp.]|nr:DUF456 domain-containing protein [Treponema sp.]